MYVEIPLHNLFEDNRDIKKPFPRQVFKNKTRGCSLKLMVLDIVRENKDSSLQEITKYIEDGSKSAVSHYLCQMTEQRMIYRKGKKGFYRYYVKEDEKCD